MDDNFSASPARSNAQIWQELRQTVAAAAQRSGRAPDAVTIVAVSKTVDTTRIASAVLGGWKELGENRVQELVAKQARLSGLQAHWHMIGSLQRNKVKDLVGRVTMLHSLDRLSLADELQKHLAQRKLPPLPCFIEVNVGGEATKAGVTLDELPVMLHSLCAYPLLRIVGLMTVAPPTPDVGELRAIFRNLKQAKDELHQLQLPWAPLEHLSMGMSSDYEIAIEEGADLIRLGTAIFGERQPKM